MGEAGTRLFLEACDLRRKPSGSTLFREGDVGAGLFMILSGSVKLIRLGRDGRETILHIAEPPGVIAEAALFIGRYPASAVVLNDCELLFLPKERAFALMEKNGPFARFLLDGMSLWLKRMVVQIEQLTTNDATARLSRYLLELYEKTPPKISPTAPRVTLPVKKGELALLLNMQLPSLSRIFRKLQDERVIEVRGKSIVLLEPAALRRMTLPPLE